MTRINCIPVDELCDQHLLAEWNELPRVFTALKKKVKNKTDLPPVPETYRMGEGHVTFFYNKAGYLLGRLYHLKNELAKRGYKPATRILSHNATIYCQLPQDWRQEWEPTPEAMAINRERINARLAGMPAARWYGKARKHG